MRNLLLLALCSPFVALAQTAPIPKDVVDRLAKDLANLQREVQAAQVQQQATNPKPALMGLIVTEPTFLRTGAADKASTLYQVNKGTTFPVVSQVGDWYAVQMDEPYKGFNTAWVKAAAAVPVTQDFLRRGSSTMGSSTMGIATDVVPGGSSVSDALFARLAESAAGFRQSYQNNPYITVTGFVVNVMPPSVSINFEFKK